MNRLTLVALSLGALAGPVAAAEVAVPIYFAGGPLAGGAVEKIPIDPSFSEDEGIARVEASWFETDNHFGAVRWVRLRAHWQWENNSYLTHATRLLSDVVPGEQERVSGDRDTVNGFLGEHRIVQIDSRSGNVDCGAYSLHRNHDLIVGFVCTGTGQPLRLAEAMQNLTIDGVIGP